MDNTPSSEFDKRARRKELIGKIKKKERGNWQNNFPNFDSFFCNRRVGIKNRGEGWGQKYFAPPPSTYRKDLQKFQICPQPKSNSEYAQMILIVIPLRRIRMIFSFMRVNKYFARKEKIYLWI